MNLEMAFRSNTEDDNHCVQASLGMVLNYFEPDRHFSWDKLDEITAANSRYWTWPMAMLLWLNKNGYEVKVYDLFDYKTFAEQGAQYMYDMLGNEVGEAQELHSDIPKEQERARQIQGVVDIHTVQPGQADIRQVLDDGYVPLCRVNSAALNGREGYYGHSIIVKGYFDGGLIIHDPGLPPLENRHVLTNDFENAWAYPVPESKNITAIKLL